MTEPLPRGISYEADRKRFRVRLYRGPYIVWRTSHFDLSSALEALTSALEVQRTWQPKVKTKKPQVIPQTILDLFK